MEKGKKQIASIDFVRVICAYMIVVIHTHPFDKYNEVLSYIATQVIPRIGVPYFFVVSGYFFTRSLITNKKIIARYLKRIVLIYTLWSIIYIVVNVLFFQIREATIVDIIKNLLLNYFIYGSWYHFWYFPTLLFCVLVSVVSNKFKKLKLLAYFSIAFYFIGLLGCSYYNIGLRISILNKLYMSSQFDLLRRVVFMGLPFFMLGYLINIHKDYLIRFNRKKDFVLLLLLYIGFLLEIIFVIILELQINIIITLFLYLLVAWIFVLCIKYPINLLNKYTVQFKYIANLTYYIHPLLFIIISIITSKFLMFTIKSEYLFLITCVATTILALTFYKINNKWLNKLVL